MGHDPNICNSLGRAFEVLGKRWTGVILGVLLGGPTGFAAIKREVGGITDSVLSDRLSELTELGLVERTVVTDTRPPGVQYALTEAALRCSRRSISSQPGARAPRSTKRLRGAGCLAAHWSAVQVASPIARIRSSRSGACCHPGRT